jgi:hypothetical protein
MQEPGPNTVFCVPSKTPEAWLIAAVFPDAHRLMQDLECNLNLEAQLAALPKGQRIKKTPRDYRAREGTMAEVWSAVRLRCTQAERFSREIAAVPA